jgi:hypothetical protein
MKIDNPELVRLLGASKVNLNKLTVDLLEDLNEIRTDSKSECDEDMVRRAGILMRMFTVVTGFVARTPELADGDDPEVTGARESKANRKSVPSGYTKLPRPADA